MGGGCGADDHASFISTTTMTMPRTVERYYRNEDRLGTWKKKNDDEDYDDDKGDEGFVPVGRSVRGPSLSSYWLVSSLRSL